MAFVLTLLYVVLTIISPTQFGKAWADYHVLTILGGAIVVTSLPGALVYGRLKPSVQTVLLLGFTISIGLSRIVNGWFGGALRSWGVFLPSAAVYFFLVASVNTTRKLKITTSAVVVACLIVAVEGMCGYYDGFGGTLFVLERGVYAQGHFVRQFAQIRGAGFLNDPNDLAQMLLIALPLVFVTWQRDRPFANALKAIVPSVLLLWATYLTHSRGALVGLAVIALVECQRRLPTAIAITLVGLLVAGMLALNFSGGRGISIADGSDRLEAWSHGLQMFKRAPLFGLGFGAFTDLNDITAHNSLVLCLAELGLVGSTLWVALLVTSTLGLSGMMGKKKRNMSGDRHDRKPIAQETTAHAEMAMAQSVAQHSIGAIRLALISFITTSWFLSRTYSTTMYLILGLATVTIALQQPTLQRRNFSRCMFFTLTAEGLAIILIYGVVRLNWR